MTRDCDDARKAAEWGQEDLAGCREEVTQKLRRDGGTVFQRRELSVSTRALREEAQRSRRSLAGDSNGPSEAC